MIIGLHGLKSETVRWGVGVRRHLVEKGGKLMATTPSWHPSQVSHFNTTPLDQATCWKPGEHKWGVAGCFKLIKPWTLR